MHRRFERFKSNLNFDFLCDRPARRVIRYAVNAAFGFYFEFGFAVSDGHNSPFCCKYHLSPGIINGLSA